MLQTLFPSWVYNFDCTSLSEYSSIDHELNQYIDITHFDYLPWFGKTHKLSCKSFHIEDAHLFQDCPLFKKLIKSQLEKYLQEVHGSKKAQTINTNLIQFGSSWATRFDEGDYGHQHQHVPDEISCVYYHKVPANITDDGHPKYYSNNGYLYFVSPLVGHYYSPLVSPQKRVFVRPEVGRLLLFPSYLEHGVSPCPPMDGPRISISGNMSINSAIYKQTIDAQEEKSRKENTTSKVHSP